MSSHQLREKVRERLRKGAEEQAAVLAEQTSATLDQMRLAQGIITGLRMAENIIDEEFRNLMG